jgi:hypothetical protein
MCKYNENSNATVGYDIDIYEIALHSEDPEQIKAIYEDLVEGEDDQELIESILMNQHTPVEVLWKFTDGWNDEKVLVARHQNASEDILKILAMDECDDVRKAVAKNNNTTEAMLDIMCNDRCLQVREAVAKNKSIGRYALSVLMTDSDEDVRAAVAANTKIDLSVIHTLMYDDSEKVKYSLKANTVCTA